MKKTYPTDSPRPVGRRMAATLGLAALAGALLTALPEARATQMAYEGFNYATGNGNLSGLGGGFGWGGTWQTVNNGSSSVQAGSLTAGANAPAGFDALSTGNAAFTPNGTREGRALDLSAAGTFGTKGYLDGNGNIGAAGKTIYISFLQQPNSANNNYYEFEFHRGDLGDGGRIGGVGNDTGGSGNVFLRTPSNSQTLIGPGSSAVSFYVVRIDFMGGNDNVTVYQNPTSATEPAAPTLTVTGAGDMSFSGVSFGAFVNGRTVAHDEIRIGETWADVTSQAVYSKGIWDGGGADNNWNTGGNWDNDIVPIFATSLTFAGNTRLANVNNLTGVSANNITFDAAAGAFTLSGNSLGLNGNIAFSGIPAAPITQTINLPLTPSGNVVIDTPTNGSISIGGDITGANTEITHSSTGNVGVLTLGGNNTLKGMVINGGTNRITGTTTINGIGGSSFFYLADGNVTRQGTLVIENGATLSVNGAFQDAAVVGRDGGVGTIIQNGGTFNFNINDFNHSYLFVGASANSNTRAEYDMNGGVLDMNGWTLGLALGANVTITGLVNQVSGVVTNVGTLFFDPNFAQGYGIYNLTGGSLYIGSGGITNFVGGSYEMNVGGGTVGAVADWSTLSNLKLTGINGAATIKPNSYTITLNGVLSGPGGLTVSGPGTLRLGGANTYTGDTTVNAGSTLELDVTGSSAGALRLANGAGIILAYNGTFVVAACYTNGVALPVGTYAAGDIGGSGPGILQVSHGISTGIWTGAGANNNWSTANNWDQNAVPIFPKAIAFAGTSRLVNNNDLSGITVSGITFDAAAGAFVLNGNDITLTGTIGFNGNPAAPVTETVNLNLALSSDLSIDTPTNGNLSLGGNISSANQLIKVDNGTLTLGGVDAFSGYILNGGTNIITGNTTISGNGGRFYVANASSNYVGTVVIQPGATLTVNGSFGDAGVIGRDGGSGTVIQNGGTFTFAPANVWYLFIGAASYPGTRSEYDMKGGVLDMNYNTLGIALGDRGIVDTCVVNQTGGVIDNVGNLQLGALTASGYGIYNLSGGRINIGTNPNTGVGGITTASGTYAINLGGGTVGALGSWSSPLNMNLTNWNGSVTFDTAGNQVTLSGVLSGNGGLTVTGGGTLELSGANSYTGDTVVNAGSTLMLDTAGSSTSTFRLANGAALNLNFSGTYTLSHVYTNGVAVGVGTYTATTLPSFIQGAGNLQVAGLVFSVQPQNQLIYLNGNYHQAVTLNGAVVGGTATFQWYLNNTPVSGATSTTTTTSLTLSDLNINSGGNVYIVATGTSGSVTSAVASVTIYAVNNNVFAYDGFAYPPAGVDGSSQAGGFGWNGPWQAVDGNGVVIAAGNLVGGANVPAGYDSESITNSIEVPSFAQTRSGRYFDCSSSSELYKQGFIDANGNIGANGKTIYLSFLEQPDRTSGFYELEFHKANLSDPGRIGGIGNDAGGNNVNLRAPNSVNNRSLGAGSTDVNLYVVRIDYKAGNDDVFVYRNPTSVTEPLTPTLTVSNVADMSFNGVSVAAYNGPDLKVDEIRLGATWADAIGRAVSNLLPPNKTANGWKVRFAATPGYSYRIQRATAVTGPWVDVTTVTGNENGYVEYEDTAAPAGNAFYRTITP